MLVGLPAVGARLDLDPGQFVRREKHLTGTMYGSEDPSVALPILLEHVRAGRLELASLVGERYPLDDADEAVAAALAGTGGRVLVSPSASRLEPVSSAHGSDSDSASTISSCSQLNQW